MSESIQLNQEPMTGTVRDFPQLRIIRADSHQLESLWDHMVREYHYLGYQKMIGPRVKYLVFTEDRPIAALSYNQASLTLGAREEYIGWDANEKKRLLPHLVNNNRFLILPWVRVKNLASHILSASLKMLKRDWFALYGRTPYMVETFVDLNRNKGICYRASNWDYLGETKGYTKVGNTFVYHGNRKGVYIYFLEKSFLRITEQNRASRSRALKTADREKLIMMLQTPDWNPTILKDAGITPDSVMKIADILFDHIYQYKTSFSREKQYKHAVCYIKGLLSDLERKSVEPIALRYAETEKEVRNMQYFTQQGAWDDGKMLAIYQADLSKTIIDKKAAASAMITFDGSCIPKKGTESVGVARQYCGRLGKVDNCQEGVFAGYTGDKGYGLIATRLYMPGNWFEDDHKERREKCGVPEDLEFKTKPEIASKMLKDIISSGLFPAQWVGVDSTFGSDQDFLDSLPENMFYYADIRKNASFFTSMPEVAVPPYKGKGKEPVLPKPSFPPITAESIANDPSIKWENTYLGEGAKGPIYGDTACIRVIENRNGLPGNEIWLYMRRLSDGSLKFSKSNAPKDTPKSTLDEQAIKRWPIEQCFEECKSQLGMDHCESRSWNSWHRHMLLVFVAHLFVQKLRLQFKKDTPILTFAQAQNLVRAAFNGTKDVILKMINLVAYHLRRNYTAYLSHKKRATASLC
jgi:SRSO17 transposase